MKKNILKSILLVFFAMGFMSCEDLLQEKVYSELETSNFLTTKSGIDALLYASYNNMSPNSKAYMITLFHSFICGGIGWSTGGSFELTVGKPLREFTWLATQPDFLSWWTNYYRGIRNANIAIDAVKNGIFPEDYQTQIISEAKALRGYFYYNLYMYFGPVPLFIKSSPENLIQPRATDEEIRNQIEKDLTEAANDLPVNQKLFGKVTKGAALGILCKFYLNTSQWQKCVNTAQEIIDLGEYHLVPKYSDIYSFDNEGNDEVVWVIAQAASPVSECSNIIANTVPQDFKLLPGQMSYAARNYLYDSFVNSFAGNDQRKDLILKQWVNNKDITIVGYGKDQSLPMKYPIDPKGIGDANGIDFMRVRYADILLSLAEALNELNGPNQVSIDLINQIRVRAGTNIVQLSDFSTKESLRDHLLKERLWEFYYEAMEREDLLRHGKFISNAQARGINAQDYHKVFPIPQSEVDTNPMIVQNPGY